jgi:hypothetical protein
MTLRTSKPNNATTPADKNKQGAHNDQQPISNDPNHILYLQRTIGNRAVNQLLAAQQPAITISQSGSPSLQPKIQRKIMSYKAFLELTEQKNNPAQMEIFSGKVGQKNLNDTRKKLNPDSSDLSDADVKKDANINAAYLEATNSESIGSLTKLHDTIQYWQTMFVDTQPAQAQKKFLDGLRELVSNRIMKLIKKENSKTSVSGLVNKSKDAVKGLKNNIPGRNDGGLDEAGFVAIDEMPAYMKEVGISQEYYEDNFIEPTTGKMIKGRIFYLELIIRLLKESKSTGGRNLDPVDEGFALLEEEGVEQKSTYLLRAVLYSHYGIVLDKIMGTDRDSSIGQPLTLPEIQAIITYSEGGYGAINKEAREATPGAKPAAGKHQNTMELAVSGLNKLPRYQGIAYRGLVKPPPGFAAYAQEGAVTSDLGFSSASPAMTAVYNFLDRYTGPRNIIYIVQSKTASNIISLSTNVAEAEVLFRPGTRFKVDKIWTHDTTGKIPQDAPADVQMILHKKGELVDRNGDAFAGRGPSFQTQVIVASEV